MNALWPHFAKPSPYNDGVSTSVKYPESDPLPTEIQQLLSNGGPLEVSFSFALTQAFSQWADEREAPAPQISAAQQNAEKTFSQSWSVLSAQSKETIADGIRALHAGGASYRDLFELILSTSAGILSRAALQFSSSRTLNKLIGGIANPARRILDPACGFGGTLLAVATESSDEVVGIDPDPESAAISTMRLLLANLPQARIVQRDSLMEPGADGWDLIVSHPPLNLRLQPDQVDEDLSRELRRGESGTVDGNALWLELISQRIAPGGQALVVVSPASLSDRNQIGLVRNRLVRQGLLGAIIALPAGMVPGSDSATFLWVLSGSADPRKKSRVLVVNGAYGDDPDAATVPETELVRTWVNDATFETQPPWYAALVDGERLLELGFAPQIHLSAPVHQSTNRPPSAGRLLTALHLQDFKSVSGELTVPLKPLTLIFGENSAGKSSLIQSLLLLRQSVEAGTFTASGRYASLGSLSSLLHNHDESGTLEVGVSFASSPQIDSTRFLPNPGIERHFKFRFNKRQLGPAGSPTQAVLGLGGDTYTFTRTGRGYTLPSTDLQRALQALHSSEMRVGTTVFPMNSEQLRALVDVSESAFPGVLFSADGLIVGPIDRQFREQVSYRTSGSAHHQWGSAALLESGAFMASLGDELRNLLERFVYLGPLRRSPERFSHRGSFDSSYDMPFYLLENASERADVSAALQRLGIHYTMDVVNPVADEQRNTLGDMASIILTDTRSGVKVTPADVGFGISQVLPIVTELSARSNSLIMIEQPEIHLHPRMQAELADLLIESTDAAGRANQVIAETHSETMIMRLQRRVREQAVSPSDILILHVGQTESGEASVQELRMDENGEFLDRWPGGFFDEQFNEMFMGL